MREFNMDMVEVLSQTRDTLILRTADLLPTLLFMQKCGWRLKEMIPDDEGEFEFEILSFYRLPPGQQKQN